MGLEIAICNRIRYVTLKFTRNMFFRPLITVNAPGESCHTYNDRQANSYIESLISMYEFREL